MRAFPEISNGETFPARSRTGRFILAGESLNRWRKRRCVVSSRDLSDSLPAHVKCRQMAGVQRRRRATSLASERQRAVLYFAGLENDVGKRKHQPRVPIRNVAASVRHRRGGHRHSYGSDELGHLARRQPLPDHQRKLRRYFVTECDPELATGTAKMSAPIRAIRMRPDQQRPDTFARLLGCSRSAQSEMRARIESVRPLLAERPLKCFEPGMPQ